MSTVDSSGRFRSMAGLHGPAKSPLQIALAGRRALYPALDLGQSDSRNLADACGHGWDRLDARAVHCRHADPFGWRDLDLTVRDVGHLAARATGSHQA